MTATEAFFEDEFDRADNTDVANGWTFDGELQIINETVTQGTGASVIASAKLIRTATSAGSEIGADYVVQAILSVDADTTDPAGTVMLRWNSDTNDGYGCRLLWEDDAGTEKLTLQIRKSVAGTPSTLTSLDVTSFANTSSDSYDDVFQNLRVAIRDEDEAVIIEAKLNDEAEPLLTYEDRVYPQFRSGGSFGLIYEDEVGVAGHVFLKSIAIQSIQETQGDYSVQPVYWTFGRIVTQAIAESTRDSNSHIDDETFKVWVNGAIQEMWEYAHRPSWGDDIIQFKTKANVEDYELPPEVYYYADVLRDTTQQYNVDIVPTSQFRRSNANTTSGTPYEAYEVGKGPNDGIMLRLYPKPSATRTYTLEVSKAPRYLTEDDQIPDVPQNLCHWISWGAVMRYSGRDSDRTHINFAAGTWREGLKAARRQARRASSSSKFIIGSGLKRRTWNDYERSRYGLRR